MSVGGGKICNVKEKKKLIKILTIGYFRVVQGRFGSLGRGLKNLCFFNIHF